MSPEDIYGLSDNQYAVALARLEKQQEEELQAKRQNRLATFSRAGARFARDTYKERSTDIRRLLGKQEIGPDGKARDLYSKAKMPFLEKIKNLNPFRDAEKFVRKIDYSRPDLTYKINQNIEKTGGTPGKTLEESVDNLYNKWQESFKKNYFNKTSNMNVSSNSSDMMDSAIEEGFNSPLPEGGPMMASLDGSAYTGDGSASTGAAADTTLNSEGFSFGKTAGKAIGAVGLGMNLYEMRQENYKKMNRKERALHTADTAASAAALANPALAPIKLLTSLARLID
tara:strand:+ start:1416 stop:2267 length:852 start_codon:yes stop_codon:yes gene_type:complete